MKELEDRPIMSPTLWRVPQLYVDKARQAMDGLDLDLSMPPWDALEWSWQGRVFLVPPATRGRVLPFIRKLLAEIEAGNVTAAVLLTNNSTDTKWFALANRISTRVCFPRGRIRFIAPDGLPALPLQGQAVMYFGNHPERFQAAYADVGVIVRHFVAPASSGSPRPLHGCQRP